MKLLLLVISQKDQHSLGTPTGWLSLPHELAQMILLYATRVSGVPGDFEGLMCLTACRFVCKQWKSSLPRPSFEHHKPYFTFQRSLQLQLLVLVDWNC